MTAIRLKIVNISSSEVKQEEGHFGIFTDLKDVLQLLQESSSDFLETWLK